MLMDAQLWLDQGSSLAIAAPGQASAITIDLLGAGVGAAASDADGGASTRSSIRGDGHDSSAIQRPELYMMAWK